MYDQTQLWAQAPGFDPLDGEGGLYATGRWNQKGTRMTYLASGAALVVLEVLVHVPAPLFGERTLVQVEVPGKGTEEIGTGEVGAGEIGTEEVGTEALIALLRDARDAEREEETRRFGSTWAREGRSLLLKVPSMVVPHEHNYLMNPLHPHAPQVRVVSRERLRLDRRLTPP